MPDTLTHVLWVLNAQGQGHWMRLDEYAARLKPEPYRLDGPLKAVHYWASSNLDADATTLLDVGVGIGGWGPEG